MVISKSWCFLASKSRIKMTTLMDQILASYGRSEKVKIKNVESTEKFLQNIVSGGPKQLQVITDFDQTLSRSHDKGKKCETTYGVIANSPLVSDNIKSYIWELYEKYHPIEIDITKSAKEKHPLMVEWYEKSHVRFLETSPKIKQSQLYEMVKNSRCKLRDNTDKFLGTLYKHEIPTLVLSAGMGNVVEEVLKGQSLLYPNTKIISNFMEFDENGDLIRFSEPIIHVFNKNEAVLHDDNSGYFTDLKNRHNVILLGDSLGDINMATGVKHANAVLKIGFLNSHFDEHLPKYMDSYDVVLLDDQSLDFANAIIDLVIGRKC